jgi:diguanylate cyclase (GGDEF)-like protein/PAS domain S-box-containing protein
VQIVHTTTVSWLVAASVLTSVIASYTAFGFTERLATSTNRKAYWFWLTSGASAMGLGIWSMHYLGMLAVRLPIEVVYHVPTVLLSLSLAILASAVVLVIVSKDNPTTFDSVAGSLLMGAGIGAMHYTGMHAMRCEAMHQYDLRVVALSVVVAVAFSWLALQISFRIRRRPDIREWLRLMGAAVMGTGIAAMHYTAMAAVTFRGDSMRYSTENTIRVSTIGVAAIVFTATVVLFGALLTTLLDRKGYEQLRKVMEELSEERDRFSAAAESSLDSFYICSAVRGKTGEIEDFAFTYLNRNVETMIAQPRDQLLGHNLCEVFPSIRSLGLLDRYRQVVSTGEPLAVEFAFEDRDVPGVWFRVQAVKVRDGIAITASDITARKRDEERIIHLAHHDPLTGLANRSLLNDRIIQAIDRAARYGGMVGVFLIDLDGFKPINDTLGHAVGDGVLVGVARVLKGAVRAVDSVMRIGGDEFVVVMPEVGSLQGIEAGAKRMLEAVQPVMNVLGQQVRIGCSIGVSVYPDSALTAEELLAKADSAMYAAKHRGKNQYEVWSPQPEAQTTAHRLAHSAV